MSKKITHNHLCFECGHLSLAPLKQLVLGIDTQLFFGLGNYNALPLSGGTEARFCYGLEKGYLRVVLLCPQQDSKRQIDILKVMGVLHSLRVKQEDVVLYGPYTGDDRSDRCLLGGVEPEQMKVTGINLLFINYWYNGDRLKKELAIPYESPSCNWGPGIDKYFRQFEKPNQKVDAPTFRDWEGCYPFNRKLPKDLRW